jgi:metal-responsive CopG/Arc/MetJ family transcriptional regulator
MGQSAAQALEKKTSKARVSVPVTPEVLQEIDSRARRLSVSRSTLMSRLLQYGLEAEQQKRDQLAQKVRQLRECADPNEAERLGDELGKMIWVWLLWNDAPGGGI